MDSSNTGFCTLVLVFGAQKHPPKLLETTVLQSPDCRLKIRGL